MKLRLEIIGSKKNKSNHEQFKELKLKPKPILDESYITIISLDNFSCTIDLMLQVFE